MSNPAPAESPSPAPPPAVRFPTPIAQSPRSDVLEWRFPRPYAHFVLTGKSRAAWHTSFVIPQLNLLLDAGLCVNKLRPKHIFLTHGHSDHTLLAPAFMMRGDPPDIYCHADMKAVFDGFVLAHAMLNLGGLVSLEEALGGGAPSDAGSEISFNAGDEGPEANTLAATVAAGTYEEDAVSTAAEYLETHVTHGLRAGDVVTLPRARDVTATAFDCDHTVPCLGYVFSLESRRLRPEHVGLAPAELEALRRVGAELTAPHSTPMFAFLGDTTPAPLAADPPWLRRGVAVVITECTFLRDEHRLHAARTKHTAWADLAPVVRRWPRTTFVLIHFSLRYTDEEVRRFFAEMEDPPPNIVPWIDGGDRGG